MIGPVIDPRVKEPRERPGDRIKTGEIRPLVTIAEMTGKSEICSVITSVMLPCHDVSM